MSGGVVVIRKSTGLPVIEMFAGDPDIQRVNTELFKVVPVLEYLKTLNDKYYIMIELDKPLDHWRARIVKEAFMEPKLSFMECEINSIGTIPPMIMIHVTRAQIGAFKTAPDRAAWVQDYVKSGRDYVPNSTFPAWLADQG